MKERRYRLVHEELNHNPGKWLLWETLSDKVLPPNARVLTREQVEKALTGRSIWPNEQQAIVNELFGSESE